MMHWPDQVKTTLDAAPARVDVLPATRRGVGDHGGCSPLLDVFARLTCT